MTVRGVLLLSLLALGTTAAACTRTADVAVTDTLDSATAAAEPISSGLATDGSLTVDVPPELRPSLRSIADSFVVREAIQVNFSGSGRVADADLLVVTVNELRTLPADSVAWTLAFAIRAPDSVVTRSPSDSTGVLLFVVPTNATNTTYVERFVRYVLDDARSTLPSLGLVPLVRREVRGHGVPPSISAIVDTVVPVDTVRRTDTVPPP